MSDQSKFQEPPGTEPQPVREDSFTVPLFSVSDIRAMLSHVTGLVKTIVDSSITDPRQNKACKDLVHAALWRDGYTPLYGWANRKCDELDGRQRPDEFWPFPFGQSVTYGAPDGLPPQSS